MKPSGDESATIVIAAALLVGKDDRLLLVRKRCKAKLATGVGHYRTCHRRTFLEASL